MPKFDYAFLNGEMDKLRQSEKDQAPAFLADLDVFLDGQNQLPLECADAIYFTMKYKRPLDRVMRCFDAYRLYDVLSKMLVDHADMAQVVYNYVTENADAISEEVYPRLWLAQVCRFAAANAHLLPKEKRLKLFYTFVDNAIVYTYSIVREEALNPDDVLLLPPEMRFAYWMNVAVGFLSNGNTSDAEACFEHASDACSDMGPFIREIRREQSNTAQNAPEKAKELYKRKLADQVKAAYEDGDLIKTAELYKKYDDWGFDPGDDLRLLTILTRLHARGLW